jgi:hypothetical protein
MTDLDLQAIHDEMVAIAYEAGAMMLKANPADIDTGTKLNCNNYPLSLLFIPPACEPFEPSQRETSFIDRRKSLMQTLTKLA